MSKFLLDANLSPETAAFLEDTFGLDVLDLRSRNLTSLPDRDIITLAKKEQRVIITLDNDFGEIYYLREKGALGVIVLRLRNQTVEAVNRALGKLFSEEAQNIELDTALVVLDEHRLRIVGPG